MKIVFISGVFDLFHEGHQYIINEAKKYGNFLVVGINSNESTKKLKGSNRPVDDEKKRVENILKAIKSFPSIVDIFNEDTPHLLIEKYQPSVIIRGNEPNLIELSGEVIQIDRLDISTTKIINESISNWR